MLAAPGVGFLVVFMAVTVRTHARTQACRGMLTHTHAALFCPRSPSLCSCQLTCTGAQVRTAWAPQFQISSIQPDNWGAVKQALSICLHPHFHANFLQRCSRQHPGLPLLHLLNSIVTKVKQRRRVADLVPSRDLHGPQPRGC